MSIGGTGNGTLQVQVLPPDLWKEQRKQFLEDDGDLSLDNHGDFDVQILGPLIVESECSAQLTAVIIERDDERIGKHKLANSARRFITDVSLLQGCVEPALSSVFQSVISGNGLFEYGIGEFCLLYGKFEERYQVSNIEAKKKMIELLGSNGTDLKEYYERGKKMSYPLPYAVRNILFHIGRNTNTLDPEGRDLTRSIELLREWTQ